MTYLAVIVFIIFAISAIIYAQRSAQKEHERRLIFARSKRLLQRANDVWDVIEQAQHYISNIETLNALVKYYTFILHERELLCPQHDTSQLVAQADVFINQFNPNDISLELTSDREIKQCKKCFAKISQILKMCASKSIIDPETFADMREKLKFTLLHLELATYEKLGDKAGENKNLTVATTYYKYAKKLLIETDLNFDGKYEHIRDISDKNQQLFGNIVKEKIDEQIERENAVDEFGFPTDLNVMAGKARKD